MPPTILIKFLSKKRSYRSSTVGLKLLTYSYIKKELVVLGSNFNDKNKKCNLYPIVMKINIKGQFTLLSCKSQQFWSILK